MENNTSLQQQLLEAGVHFGHLKKKWNPKMLPYIFAEKKGIHIIDLNKTVDGLQECAAAMKQIAKSGKKIMFVATKKQAKEIVSECAKRVNMPYATERWPRGHHRGAARNALVPRDRGSRCWAALMRRPAAAAG